MARYETPITRWYWQQLGGLLVEEYCLQPRGAQCGQRLADAIVLPGRETRIAPSGESINDCTLARKTYGRRNDSVRGAEADERSRPTEPGE